MKTLEAEFQERHASTYDQRALDNLGIVVAAHERHPITMGLAEERDARADQRASGLSGHFITINRGIDRIAAFHGVVPGQLIRFAEGGTVVDIGSGTSSFLDHFAQESRTLAIDRRREHVRYQQERGHGGVVAMAHDLHQIPAASVRLAHATFSAPFWSASKLEASGAAREYARILEPGGIALVGPIARTDLHRHYEHVVGVAQFNGSETLPWPLDTDRAAYLSQILCAFIKVVLDRRLEQGGDIDVTGNRIMLGNDRDENARFTDLHVPNFLMIRKK